MSVLAFKDGSHNLIQKERAMAV